MKKQQIRAQIDTQRRTFTDREKVKPTEELPRRQAELIDMALRAFEARLLSDKDLKPTLTEYLKLLQVEKEVAQETEGPREIKVTWIEPDGTSLEE
jgi:hypothetical protein